MSRPSLLHFPGLSGFAARLALAAALALAILGTSRLSQAASLYPSFDPNYFRCEATLYPFVAADLYVSASYYASPPSDPGILVQGITGGEFRLEGLDTTHLFYRADPVLSGTIEGDPLVGGCRVSFPACQGWRNDDCSVPLLHLFLLPIAPLSSTNILIRPRGESCRPEFPTPFLTLCDGPAATHFCAFSRTVCINPSNFCTACPVSSPGDCVLAVTPATWSSVKALFRDRGR